MVRAYTHVQAESAVSPSNMRNYLILHLIWTWHLAGAFSNDNVPSPEPTGTLVFSGAIIHPVSSESFNGTIFVEGGKIKKIEEAGPNSQIKEHGSLKVINCSGKHIYPGMIASNTVLGLTEIRAVRATRDMIEPGEINPNVRAEVTVNPDSELLPVTRSNGVLHVLSVPQSHGLIAGQSALMKLDGWTWEEMTVKPSVGMHLRWPNVPDPGTALNAKQKKALKEASDKTILQLNRLKESFNRARAYLNAKKAGSLPQKTDLRWESMKGVLSGAVPLFVHVNRLFEIQAAVKFSVEQRVKIVIVGGSDAWRAIPLLKKHDVPVIISPVNSLPGRRWEDYDTAMVNPVKLQRAGVRFCITGRGGSMDAAHERNLPYQAARAAAFGLPKEEALKSVTLYPAQILGVGDRLGSLDVGKDASFIITSGDPLEVTTKIYEAYIEGRPIDMSNKQTRLYEKYKKKYLQKKKD